MKGLFSTQLNLTSKVMDLRMKRQNLVMSNLANIETPNYKARSMEWESELQEALGRDARGQLSRSNQRHMPAEFTAGSFTSEYEQAWQPHLVIGDDSVDLDKETAKMSKNIMMYNALSTVLKKNFEGLNTIIMEGAK